MNLPHYLYKTGAVKKSSLLLEIEMQMDAMGTPITWLGFAVSVDGVEYPLHEWLVNWLIDDFFLHELDPTTNSIFPKMLHAIYKFELYTRRVYGKASGKNLPHFISKCDGAILPKAEVWEKALELGWTGKKSSFFSAFSFPPISTIRPQQKKGQNKPTCRGYKNITFNSETSTYN